ncbi:hypothetical protein vBCbaSRXM_60 [Citromicrobium phage vB_CbaS-RXM]|nr:hypothetical protein vBCbaSRXM_60 [Citromicrobium phage vB_CbaS-RXM]
MTGIPKKGKTFEFQIGDRTVSLTNIPVRRHDWDHSGKYERDDPRWGHPKEQTLLEIRVDGELMGLATRQHGYGKMGFSIERLGEQFNNGWWEIGDLLVWRDHSSNGLYTGEALAERVVKLVEEKRLRTLPELEKLAAANVAEKQRRKIEEEEQQEKWAIERAERKRKATEHRDQVLDGLREIRQREGLTNYEIHALESAIKRYEGDRF